MRLWANIKCVNIGVPEGEERRGSKMYLKKLWLKTSQTQRRKQISRYRNTEGPKQDEPKQAHTKTYHN